MAMYVPRVFICGDEQKFRRTIGDKPAEVVGKIIFDWTNDEANLFLDERALTGEDIRKLLDGAADYLIFVDDVEFLFYLEKFPLNTQVISAVAFAKKIRDGFFSNELLIFLRILLNKKIYSRVLDFDCYIAKSDLHTRGDFEIELECVAENFNLYPIHENIYAKIYRTFDECKYHKFDAILLTKERTPQEFIDALIKLDDLSENILAFVRKNSALESWLVSFANIFDKVKVITATNGAWCLIKKRVSTVDAGIYVVTHKDIKLDTLPEGYRAIHAGHAQAKKFFGYAGDDTGENISRLNHFLDEITALYWIWKNTSHTHTGIVHYRRFFTADTNQENFDAEKILSSTEIFKLLDEYDIIVHEDYMTNRTQREMMNLATGSPELVNVAEKILRKHLTRTQPDYLDAFDEVINGFVFFLCGIHITRRNIFNAYCEWLFSFIIDATEELRAKVQVGDKTLDDVPHIRSRIMSHLSERMLTVWLMKNHLRIKTLPIMFRDDV